MEIEVVVAPVVCERSAGVPSELFELLDTLPSYMRPRATFSTRTAQLMRLAATLNEHGLVANASKKARDWIVNQMRAADSQQQDEIDAKVSDTLALTVGTLTVGLGPEITTTTTTTDSPTMERDLDGYFTRAQRLLPDGSASWYFNDLCDRGYDEVDAGVRLAAMAGLGFKDVVERQAAEQIMTWRDAHASAVSRMPRAARDLGQLVRRKGPHPATVELGQR